jgi:nucleoside-diphosphate-sugar epimerase
MAFQLVLGHGPAGAATARLLVERGDAVRVVTRSATTVAPGVEHRRLDAADSAALTRAADGATAIYACASPPYHRWPVDWPPLVASIGAAAQASGALLVMLSNCYGYGPVHGPLTEDLPLAASGPKGRARAAVWTHLLGLHQQGRLRAVEVRASDFFGPGVTTGGHLAARLMPPLLRGRPVRVLGDPDVPHSWTYLPDVARALVRVADVEAAWGRPWHVPTAPASSARTMIDALARQAGRPPVPVRRLSWGLVRALGLVSPPARELQEIRYQFDRPFTVDSSAFSARFGDQATPVEEQVGETVAWWRSRPVT